MSKGYQKHQERQQALSLLGKDLTRRSRSQCELCQANGARLSIYEVAPVPSEPQLEHCLFVCEPCSDQLRHPRRIQPAHWHCLSTAIWSPVPAVQVVAVRLLKRLSDQPWAAELLEQAYLPPEVQEWAVQA